MLKALVMLTTLCLAMLVGMAFVSSDELKESIGRKMDQVVQWVNHVDKELAPQSKQTLSQTLGEVVDQMVKDFGTESQNKSIDSKKPQIKSTDNTAVKDMTDVTTTSVLPEDLTEIDSKETLKITTQAMAISAVPDPPVEKQEAATDKVIEEALTPSFAEPTVDSFDPVQYETYQAEMSQLSERTLQSLNLIDVHLGRD